MYNYAVKVVHSPYMFAYLNVSFVWVKTLNHQPQYPQMIHFVSSTQTTNLNIKNIRGQGHTLEVHVYVMVGTFTEYNVT